VAFLNCSILLFSIQQLTEEAAGEIHSEANAAEVATHVGINDVLCCQKKGATYIMMDPYTFLEWVASFQALVHVLFGSASPCTLMSKNSTMLLWRDKNKATYVPSGCTNPVGLAMHVLWQIYLYTQNYFNTSLCLDQLDHGA